MRALLRNRQVAVGAGVTLVLVPTLFSLFPAWQEWGIGVRVVILLGWLLAAVLVVWSTTIQSEQVDELVGEPLRRQTAARQAAAQRLLSGLLEPGAAGLPEKYETRVYLPDEHGVLQPAYAAQQAGIEDLTCWPDTHRHNGRPINTPTASLRNGLAYCSAWSPHYA